MKLVSERASARTGEACPIGSQFSRIAAAIDRAEAIAWDRVGRGTDAEERAIVRLEQSLPTPVTADDWRWAYDRLVRAFEHGWTREAAEPILRFAEGV